MEKSLIIEHVNIYTKKKLIKDGSVLIQNGKIEKIVEGTIDVEVDTIDGAGLNLVPGFIDGHIHGAGGYDVMDQDPQALTKIAEYLPKEGTTSFVATTITNPIEEIHDAMVIVRDYESHQGEAEILGLHIEGPFIEKDKAGAQPEQYILNPDLNLLEKWLDLANGSIKAMTIAPELDQDGRFMKMLRDNDINVSIGHTNATYKDVLQATERGANQMTHLCNAMNGIHHRDVGAVGAAILNENLLSEVIADGIHLSPEMLQILFKSVGPERLMLITDSMR